jgi:hypothetical protein
MLRYIFLILIITITAKKTTDQLLDSIGISAIDIYRNKIRDKWCRTKYTGNENVYKEKYLNIKNTLFDGMCTNDIKLFEYNSTYKCPLGNDCIYDICMTEDIDKIFNEETDDYQIIKGFINTRGFVRLHPGRYSNIPEYHFNVLEMRWYNRILYGQYSHYYILDNISAFDKEYNKILKIRRKTHNYDTINIIRIIGDISFKVDKYGTHELLYVDGGLSSVINYINVNDSECTNSMEDIVIITVLSQVETIFKRNKKKILVVKSISTIDNEMIDSLIDLDMYNNRHKIYTDIDNDGLWDIYFKNKIIIRSKRIYDNMKLIGLSFIMNLKNDDENRCTEQNITIIEHNGIIYNETLNTTIIYMNKTIYIENNTTIKIFYPIFNNTDICCSQELIEEIIIISLSVVTTIVLIIIAAISSYCFIKKKSTNTESSTEFTYSL